MRDTHIVHYGNQFMPQNGIDARLGLSRTLDHTRWNYSFLSLPNTQVLSSLFSSPLRVNVLWQINVQGYCLPYHDLSLGSYRYQIFALPKDDCIIGWKYAPYCQWWLHHHIVFVVSPCKRSILWLSKQGNKVFVKWPILKNKENWKKICKSRLAALILK